MTNTSKINSCFESRRFSDFLVEAVKRVKSLATLMPQLKKDRNADLKYIYFNMPKIVRKLVWNYYKLDKAQETLNLEENYPGISDSDRLVIDKIRTDGIAKHPVSFKADIDIYLQQNGISFDQSFHESLDFNNDLVRNVVSKSNLLELISYYYGQQAYFREEPTIHCYSYDDYINFPVPSDVYHSDGYRQVSAMLLLNDLTSEHIHMRYAVGSHQSQHPSYDRRRIDQNKVSTEFPITQVIGKAGDLFIFDTEGFHKGHYEKSSKIRAILHFNIHPGIYRSRIVK